MATMMIIMLMMMMLMMMMLMMMMLMMMMMVEKYLDVRVPSAGTTTLLERDSGLTAGASFRLKKLLDQKVFDRKFDRI